MARVIHAGVSDCPVLVVFGLVVRLRLMVGGRRVIGSRCVVNWSRGVVRGRGVRVNGGALVGDLGNIATIVVGCVPHCLDTTIREGHRVGALRNDLGLLKRSDSV